MRHTGPDFWITDADGRPLDEDDASGQGSRQYILQHHRLLHRGCGTRRDAYAITRHRHSMRAAKRNPSCHHVKGARSHQDAGLVSTLQARWGTQRAADVDNANVPKGAAARKHRFTYQNPRRQPLPARRRRRPRHRRRERRVPPPLSRLPLQIPPREQVERRSPAP